MDLTTLFVAYEATLRNAQLLEDDTTTLVVKDLPTVIALTLERDDRNTQYFEYLT